MSIEENKTLVRKFYEQVFNNQDPDMGVSMLSRDYVMHDPTDAFTGGPEGWRRLNTSYWKAFPDQVVTITAQIAEDDLVVTRWTASGTDSGTGLWGRPPTGRKFLIQLISVSRVANGKIAEEWLIWDAAGLMRQLGFERIPEIPVPA
jgi:steroid delta-isomerase-like uncharacterized protein